MKLSKNGLNDLIAVIMLVGCIGMIILIGVLFQ